MTAISTFRPAEARRAWLYDASCIMAGSLFVALSAQVAFRLPFSPVPVTGQTLAALLVGAVFGSALGSLALLAYLAEGLIGIPVFAGGAVGLVRLLGPTGGYLVGLVAAAFLTGWLAERRWDRRPITTALAMLAGNAVVYAFGLAWLSRFVGPDHVLAAGLLPFIPGDLVKVALAAGLLPLAWKLIDRR
jgi:biotin transport system substrate-specific component